MGLFGFLGRQFGVGSSAPVAPPTPGQLYGLFGPPPPQNPTRDGIAATVFAPPYRGPLDLDRYGRETPQMRDNYRSRYRDTPVLRAAIRGKVDDVSCLTPTVLAADKDDHLSNLAAEFVDWCVQGIPRGWRGLIDTLLTAGMIDGFALAEKKLKPDTWKGQHVWALDHVRSLDTGFLRLELDIYNNVRGIVNLVRGIERFDPEDVILYSHNPQFNNPFGQSDVRAALRAANVIEDVYKVWYTALKIYGLPYMVGKVKDATKKAMMSAVLEGLREAGYAVTGAEDSIEVVNLAAAAATTGFESIVNIMREDIFYVIRGVPQPFMEGDGGSNSHTDTSVQQGTSDAGERAISLDIADCINRQLIPWLVRPTFGDIAMPRVKLGGTDWKQVETIIGIIEKAQGVGMKVSAEWAHSEATMASPRDDEDVLVSAQEKQQQQQAQQQQQMAQPALPQAQPTAPELPTGGMFSDSHRPNTLPDAAQVARCVDQVLTELGV